MSLKIKILPSPELSPSSWVLLSTGSSGSSCSPKPRVDSTSKDESRPVSPSRSSTIPISNLIPFNRYIIHLFKSALGEDKNAVNILLLHPIFKERIFDVLKDKYKHNPNSKNKSKHNLNRIDILRYLAHYHINQLEKKEVTELIRAVGVSNYVSSATKKKVESLYRNLFKYPLYPRKKKPSFSETDCSLEAGTSGSSNVWRRLQEEDIVTSNPSKEPFSCEELLDFASEANETLAPYITAYVKKRFPDLT